MMTSLSKVQSLILAGTLVSAIGLVAPDASAVDACSLQSFEELKLAIVSQNKVASVPLAPATIYAGLDSAQTARNSAAGSAESQYTEQLFNKFGAATKAFIEAGGSAEAAAVKFFGDANRRESAAIYKRATAATPASVDSKCGAGSCQDIALEVTALHTVARKTAETVIDSISAAKLSSIKPAVVSFCETGSQCAAKDQLVIENSVVHRSEAASPMRLGVSYTAREVAVSALGTVDNTSLYKVTAIQVCGHQAYLMAGVSTRDPNSFMNASSDVLVVEAESRVLTIAVAQGIAVKGSSIPGIFLNSFFGAMARKTLVTGYNQESVRLGTDETVDKGGFLK